MHIRRYFTRSYWLQRYFNWQMVQFFLFKNREWDYCYFLEMLEKKLTHMGLYFAKTGLAEDSKEQTRICWRMRKAIKDIYDCEEKAEAYQRKVFFDKYGYDYTVKIDFSKVIEDGMHHTLFEVWHPEGTSEEKKKEAEAFWASINYWELERKYYKEAVDRFHTLMLESFRKLWD